MVDSVEVSFDAFMKTSLMFDSVFLADNVDTGEWFFGTLQPRYQEFREDMNALNEAIYNDLLSNSADFDAGFYRSIMPGVVSVGAGLLLIMLLLFFALTNYVIPIKRIAEGINSYRSYGKKYTYQFEGDDQLAEINTGVTEILEENVELLARIKALREGIEKTAE
jgi:hypothetical protein